MLTYCFDLSSIAGQEVSIQREVDFHRRTSLHHQRGYLTGRVYVLPAAQELVRSVFDEFIPTGASCAEFGTGMYGALYNLLIPKRLKRTWTQYEINPKRMNSNKWFTRLWLLDFRAKIKEGNMYEMPLEDNSVDCIAGLSSWDCQLYLENIMREVNRCLRPGGVFISIQDIHPAEKQLIIREARNREQQGLSARCAYTKAQKDNGYGQHCTIIDSIESYQRGFEHVPIAEFLHDELAYLCTQNGLEVKVHEKRSKTKTLSRSRHQKNLRMFFPFIVGVGGRNNSFSEEGGLLDFKEDRLIRPNVQVTYTANLLVALKVGN